MKLELVLISFVVDFVLPIAVAQKLEITAPTFRQEYFPGTSLRVQWTYEGLPDSTRLTLDYRYWDRLPLPTLPKVTAAAAPLLAISSSGDGMTSGLALNGSEINQFIDVDTGNLTDSFETQFMNPETGVFNETAFDSAFPGILKNQSSSKNGTIAGTGLPSIFPNDDVGWESATSRPPVPITSSRGILWQIPNPISSSPYYQVRLRDPETNLYAVSAFFTICNPDLSADDRSTCVFCDPLCKDAECSGPGPRNCKSCLSGLRHRGQCVARCPSGWVPESVVDAASTDEEGSAVVDVVIGSGGSGGGSSSISSTADDIRCVPVIRNDITIIVEPTTQVVSGSTVVSIVSVTETLFLGPTTAMPPSSDNAIPPTPSSSTQSSTSSAVDVFSKPTTSTSTDTLPETSPPTSIVASPVTSVLNPTAITGLSSSTSTRTRTRTRRTRTRTTTSSASTSSFFITSPWPSPNSPATGFETSPSTSRTTSTSSSIPSMPITTTTTSSTQVTTVVPITTTTTSSSPEVPIRTTTTSSTQVVPITTTTTSSTQVTPVVPITTTTTSSTQVVPITTTTTSSTQVTPIVPITTTTTSSTQVVPITTTTTSSTQVTPVVPITTTTTSSTQVVPITTTTIPITQVAPITTTSKNNDGSGIFAGPTSTFYLSTVYTTTTVQPGHFPVSTSTFTAYSSTQYITTTIYPDSTRVVTTAPCDTLNADQSTSTVYLSTAFVTSTVEPPLNHVIMKKRSFDAVSNVRPLVQSQLSVGFVAVAALLSVGGVLMMHQFHRLSIRGHETRIKFPVHSV